MIRRGFQMAAAVVFAAASLLAAPSSIAGQCEDGCGDRARACNSVGDGREQSCQSDLSSCLADCRYSGSGSGTVAGPKYGSIAYSDSTGGYGYTYDHPNQADADSDAVGYCAQNAHGAGDCRVLISFYDNCGALARASNGSYGAAWGADSQEASNAAFDVCKNYGGLDCRTIEIVCNGG